jgi:hypothetical protein
MNKPTTFSQFFGAIPSDRIQNPTEVIHVSGFSLMQKIL